MEELKTKVETYKINKNKIYSENIFDCYINIGNSNFNQNNNIIKQEKNKYNKQYNQSNFFSKIKFN